MRDSTGPATAMRNGALISPHDLAIAKEISCCGYYLHKSRSQHPSALRTSGRGWDQKVAFLDSYKRSPMLHFSGVTGGPMLTPEVRHPVHAIRYYPYFRTHSYRPFAYSNSWVRPDLVVNEGSEPV